MLLAHIVNLSGFILVLSGALISMTPRASQFWRWTCSPFNIKVGAAFASLMSMCLILVIAAQYHYLAVEVPKADLSFVIGSIPFEINDLSLLFIALVSTLMPAVIILADIDHNPRAHKYLVLLLCIYFITTLLLLTTDIFWFYVFYELLVMLVFFTMYVSTNARGCVEASLFFLGWAVVGSIFVGLAVFLLVGVTNSTDMAVIRSAMLTNDEAYILYMLSFFGFGTKLSLWPFWYWLPRAHVEVSTSMSVFLSCILIKICLYCLMRFWWAINSEVVVNPLIFLVALCVFDVTCRLIVQVDLKAIIAYGSVLHVNLLVLLILLDTTGLTIGTALYIWGHSLSTAGIFFATSLIERCYGSRSTFELAGVYNTNPLIGIFAIFAVIGFLDFPISVFFWGELWLWATLFSVLPGPAALLMFVSAIIYVIIFFRIWWGVLFGSSSQLAENPIVTLTWNDIGTAVYLILLQFIFGVQPDLFFLFTIS